MEVSKDRRNSEVGFVCVLKNKFTKEVEYVALQDIRLGDNGQTLNDYILENESQKKNLEEQMSSLKQLLKEYQEKTKQGYKANITINNDVVEITYVENKKKIYIKELQEIKKWFNSYYTEHEQKYNRLIALNKTLDDGTSPQDALNTLYSQAEEKRKQYQELETELSNV